MHATPRWNFKPLSLLVIILTVGLVSAALSLADKPPHSHGDEDPPAAPPVSYEVTWLGDLNGRALEINNSGVVVGWVDALGGGRHAFRVVPDVDAAGNLDYHPDGNGISELMEDLNPGIWIDKAGFLLVDQDWTAVEARGINTPGEIVGRATHNITGETRAFHFNPSTEQLMLLPSAGLPFMGPGSYTGQAINDDGDIVGIRVDGFESGEDGPSTRTAIFYRRDADSQVYLGWDLGTSVENSLGAHRTHLNNRAGGIVQIVTSGGFRLTLFPDLISDPQNDVFVEDFGDSIAIRRINDSGTFCGIISSSGRGKNKVAGGGFRWTGDPSDEVLIVREGSLSTVGADINSNGDVCILRNSLYTDEDGLLSLTDLVVNADVDLSVQGMNERDATGFPQMCSRGTGVPFVITPVAQ